MSQTVIVETILSEGQYGGAIFSASTVAGGKKHRFIASAEVMPRAPLLGEVWEIGGTIKKHPQHGPQVEAQTALLMRPSGRLIVQTLARSKKFPGIGEAKARALWDRFGDELYMLLESRDPKHFAELLGDELAQVLVEGWDELAVAADVYHWLDERALPLWLANKIIAIYSSEAVAKMIDNPYRLLAFTGWKQADDAARAMGVKADDERRLVGAADATVYRRLDASHTWTETQEFLDELQSLLACDSDTAQEALRSAQETHAVVSSGTGLQGIGPSSMEAYTAKMAHNMIDGGYKSEKLSFRKDLDDTELEAVFNDFNGKEGITLNDAQKSAVTMAATSPLSVLTGGAGVGKTTVLKAIHAATKAAGGFVIQMALAGRAAKRMSEATGEPAMTIQKFFNEVDRGQMILDDEPTLVIDEASMLDLPTLYRIMRHMEPGARLLLVGDPAQLPPIGFGLAFHAFCDGDTIPRVELTEVHRQAASTGIPQVSIDVRNGVVPDLSKYEGKGSGVSFIEAEKGEITNTIMDVVNDFGGVEECQIIGAVKAGPAGTKGINAVFHELLTPGRMERLNYAEGEPVIWTVNDYDLGLLNGSLGTVKRAVGELEIDFDGEMKIIPDDALRSMEHAYAITCHKSQGSQFSRVIVPVFHSKLLDRTLLYTAITRAQFQVVLIGDRKAFDAAVVAAPNPSRRQTGLRAHLQTQNNRRRGNRPFSLPARTGP